MYISTFVAGWSSLVARKAHNLEVPGSNPGPATIPGVVQTPFFQQSQHSIVQPTAAWFSVHFSLPCS